MTIFKAKERQIIRMLFSHTGATEAGGAVKVGNWTYKWSITCHKASYFRDDLYYMGTITGSYDEDIIGETVDEVMDGLEKALSMEATA